MYKVFLRLLGLSPLSTITPMWLRFISSRKKFDVSTIFPTFHNMIENQFGIKIKKTRTDNTRDYFNQTLSSYFHTEGIIHESSCVNNVQQNSVAERKKWPFVVHYTCPDTSKQSLKLWGEVALVAAHFINCTPSHTMGFQSPWHVFSQFYPYFTTSAFLPTWVLVASCLSIFTPTIEANTTPGLLSVFLSGIPLLKRVISVTTPLLGKPLSRPILPLLNMSGTMTIVIFRGATTTFRKPWLD